MPAGITFKETMTGWFALGATEPADGAARGQRAGTELALNAVVTIDDLDAFLADPQRAGGLAGTVDFQPLGFALAGTRGVFKLFSPAEQADTRLMVYELGFMVDGRPHYLAGRKIVHDDVGFDLWPDTTTLYTTLHDGADATGPVIGAGILRLGVRELMDLLSTLKPTGGGDLGTVARFGRMFFGELWALYGPHVRA
jgi:cholesterol oxidase